MRTSSGHWQHFTVVILAYTQAYNDLRYENKPWTLTALLNGFC